MTLHMDCAIKCSTAKIIESAAKGEDSVSFVGWNDMVIGLVGR